MLPSLSVLHNGELVDVENDVVPDAVLWQVLRGLQGRLTSAPFAQAPV